jgi:preprotein translocase subunit SecG
MIVILVLICVILVLIVLGFLFSNGKGASLIAGFNTKSKEEQNQYDQAALCKFMGIMNFALAFSVALWALSELFKIQFFYCRYSAFHLYNSIHVNLFEYEQSL